MQIEHEARKVEEMSTVVGKFAGGGLIVAAALLIWLYTTGGFSPVVAQTEPSVQRTFDKETVQPGDTLSVTIRAQGFSGAVVTETLHADLVYKDSKVKLSPNYPSGQIIKFALIGVDVSNTYRVTVPSTASPGDSYTFVGEAGVSDPDFENKRTVKVGGESNITVGTVTPDPVTPDPVTPDPVTPDPVTPDSELDKFELSSYVATEAVRIELEASSKAMVPAGEDLTVTLKKFGLPADIPESSVLILGKTSATAGDGAVNGS